MGGFMDKELRERIEEILKDIVEITAEDMDGIQAYNIRYVEATDQILKLFKERMLELIGDDKKGAVGLSKFMEYSGYNQAKAELRKKVGE
jgi:siroheme synthase (precorrin-2 oxidase/ferrochelatase)